MKTDLWEDKYQEIMKNQQKESMDFNMDDLMKKVDKSQPKRQKYYWMGGIAASVLVVFLIGFFGVNNQQKLQRQQVSPKKIKIVKQNPIVIPHLKKVLDSSNTAHVKHFKNENIEIVKKENVKSKFPKLTKNKKALVHVNGKPIYNEEKAKEETAIALRIIENKLNNTLKYTKNINKIIIKI